MNNEISTKFRDILFIVFHPLLSLRAKGRQVAAAIELQAPPITSTWEDYPNLPLAEAAKQLRRKDENCLFGGVPKSAWPESDQERMTRGKLPLGHPEHPNI